MNIFWSSGCDLKCWVQHLYHGPGFTIPAILRQSILVILSPSRFYRTSIETIPLYSEEFRKCLWNNKSTKNQIQLLCENSVPLDTIVSGWTTHSLRDATYNFHLECVLGLLLHPLMSRVQHRTSMNKKTPESVYPSSYYSSSLPITRCNSYVLWDQ